MTSTENTAPSTRPLVDGDHEREPGCCFDCGDPHGCAYLVHDATWLAAWPEYSALRARLATAYPKGSPWRWHVHLLLCFGCLEKRLGRPLHPSDFDLSLPINAGVAFGMRLAGAPLPTFPCVVCSTPTTEKRNWQAGMLRPPGSRVLRSGRYPICSDACASKLVEAARGD